MPRASAHNKSGPDDTITTSKHGVKSVGPGAKPNRVDDVKTQANTKTQILRKMVQFVFVAVATLAVEFRSLVQDGRWVCS